MSRFDTSPARAFRRLPGFRPAALALLTALICVAPRAHAQLELQWSAPASCPQREEVLARIRAIAGSLLEDADGLAVSAKITNDHGRFRLELLVRDGPDERKRVIASGSCAALAGAAAVTVALLLGTDASAAEPSANDPATSDQNAAEAVVSGGANRGSARDAERESDPARQIDGARADRAPDVVGQPPERTESTASRRWAILLRAPLMTADVGVFPNATFGLGAAVGVRYGAWRALLAGQVSREQTISAPDENVAFGAELQRVTAQLLGCHGWRWGQFELAPCVGVALEHVTARGFGEGVAPQPRRAVWPAPGAGAVVHWYALESLALFTGAQVHLELARPRLTIEDLGNVEQLGPVSVGAVLGLEWIL